MKIIIPKTKIFREVRLKINLNKFEIIYLGLRSGKGHEQRPPSAVFLDNEGLNISNILLI